MPRRQRVRAPYDAMSDAKSMAPLKASFEIVSYSFPSGKKQFAFRRLISPKAAALATMRFAPALTGRNEERRSIRQPIRISVARPAILPHDDRRIRSIRGPRRARRW